MSSEQLQWITIDKFVEYVQGFGATISIVNKWIKGGYLTLKQDDDIVVALDTKFYLLMYRLKTGKIREDEKLYQLGKHIKTINKNNIRKLKDKYLVYAMDGTMTTKSTLSSAIKFAESYDLFVSKSSNSEIVYLNKQDILNIKKALKALGYQGKITNKLNNVMKKFNGNYNTDNNNSSDSNVLSQSCVSEQDTKGQRQKNKHIHMDSFNNSSGANMPQIKGKKVRNIKFSSETRKYIMDKYSLSSSRLSYLLCYTSDNNMEALNLIKEAGDYERERDDRINKLKGEMYVKPTNID